MKSRTTLTNANQTKCEMKNYLNKYQRDPTLNTPGVNLHNCEVASHPISTRALYELAQSTTTAAQIVISNPIQHGSSLTVRQRRQL